MPSASSPVHVPQHNHGVKEERGSNADTTDYELLHTQNQRAFFSFPDREVGMKSVTSKSHKKRAVDIEWLFKTKTNNFFFF